MSACPPLEAMTSFAPKGYLYKSVECSVVVSQEDDLMLVGSCGWLIGLIGYAWWAAEAMRGFSLAS